MDIVSKKSVVLMLVTLKLVMLALATGGVVATGAVAAVAHIPLENAKLNKEGQLAPDSGMPEQSREGLENAYENICQNQERWLADHAPETPDSADGEGVEQA